MQPFEHVVVPAFLDPDTVARINDTFPPMVSGGSFPIESLAKGMFIKEVIEQLDSPCFEETIGLAPVWWRGEDFHSRYLI